jgi:hypothetical protein
VAGFSFFGWVGTGVSVAVDIGVANSFVGVPVEVGSTFVGDGAAVLGVGICVDEGSSDSRIAHEVNRPVIKIKKNRTFIVGPLLAGKIALPKIHFSAHISFW